VLQRLYADATWLQQLVIEELRPRPGRIRPLCAWHSSPRSELRWHSPRTPRPSEHQPLGMWTLRGSAEWRLRAPVRRHRPVAL